MKLKNVAYLILFLTVCQLVYCQDNGKANRKQQIVAKSIERLQTGAIGNVIRGPIMYQSFGTEPWILNHYLNYEELVCLADTHQNPQVRATAVWCLIEHYPKQSKEVFFRHVTESNFVQPASFCVINYISLGDFIINKAIDLQYLNTKEWKKVDSILFSSPNAVYVNRRNNILRNKALTNDQINNLREISSSRLDIMGLNCIVKEPTEDDTTLVIRALDSILHYCWEKRPKSKRDWIKTKRLDALLVYTLNQWQHPAIMRHLLTLRDTLVAQGTVIPYSLFLMVRAQDSSAIPSFAEQTLEALSSNTNNNVTDDYPLGKLVSLSIKNLDEALKFERNYNIDGYPYYNPCLQYWDNKDNPDDIRGKTIEATRKFRPQQ